MVSIISSMSLAVFALAACWSIRDSQAFVPSSSSSASSPFRRRPTTTNARPLPQQQQQLLAQRQIAEFDTSDFSLPTGEWPYSDSDFSRIDPSVDTRFYDTPRFVTHIDDRAIGALTAFYTEEMTALAKQNGDKKGGLDVLDLCSSWISHLPQDDKRVPYGNVVGIGMNEEELKANPQLTNYYVQDLNINPKLDQFDDNSFDVICNVVSVDYLTKPREIFQEMHRVLRPDGICLMSFSNRCFPTKAINMWLQQDDIGRMTIVASYFHYSAQWKSIEALDIIPPPVAAPVAPSMGDVFSNPAKGFAWMTAAAAAQKSNSGDPMYVVKAIK